MHIEHITENKRISLRPPEQEAITAKDTVRSKYLRILSIVNVSYLIRCKDKTKNIKKDEENIKYEIRMPRRYATDRHWHFDHVSSPDNFPRPASQYSHPRPTVHFHAPYELHGQASLPSGKFRIGVRFSTSSRCIDQWKVE